jgi:hypothetical protein
MRHANNNHGNEQDLVHLLGTHLQSDIFENCWFHEVRMPQRTFEFTTSASHSVHWRKLMNNATKYKANSLLTYIVTRWYSL